MIDPRQRTIDSRPSVRSTRLGSTERRDPRGDSARPKILRRADRGASISEHRHDAHSNRSATRRRFPHILAKVGERFERASSTPTHESETRRRSRSLEHCICKDAPLFPSLRRVSELVTNWCRARAI